MSAPLTFRSDATAAEFYGMTRANWMKLKALGKAKSDPLPFTSPAEMPAWFDRMRAAGHRKHRTPETINQRAAEAGDAPSTPAAPKVRPSKNGTPQPEVPPPPPRPPALPFESARAASNADIITLKRRQLSVYMAEWESAISEGRKLDAMDAKRAIDSLSDDIRKWAQSAKPISEGEGYRHESEVIAEAGAYNAAVWKTVQESVRQEFADREQGDRVIASLSKRMHVLFRQYFHKSS